MAANTIDRETLKRFRVDLDNALKPLEKKYGLRLAPGNTTFLHDRFTMKVEALLNGAKTVEENLYEMKMVQYGLPVLGSLVTIRGEAFVVKGMRPKTHKVVIQKRGEDKTVLCSCDLIAKAAPYKRAELATAS